MFFRVLNRRQSGLALQAQVSLIALFLTLTMVVIFARFKISGKFALVIQVFIINACSDAIFFGQSL